MSILPSRFDTPEVKLKVYCEMTTKTEIINNSDKSLFKKKTGGILERYRT